MGSTIFKHEWLEENHIFTIHVVDRMTDNDVETFDSIINHYLNLSNANKAILVLDLSESGTLLLNPMKAVRFSTYLRHARFGGAVVYGMSVTNKAVIRVIENMALSVARLTIRYEESFENAVTYARQQARVLNA